MKKGISMPINVIIVIIVAVLVLVGLISLYTGTWAPTASSVSSEAAKQAACQVLVSRGCSQEAYEVIVTDKFDANKDGLVDNSDTLKELCNNYYGCASYEGSDNKPTGMFALPFFPGGGSGDEEDSETVIDEFICCKQLCGCP